MNRHKMIMVCTPTRTPNDPSVHYIESLFGMMFTFPVNMAKGLTFVVGKEVDVARNECVARTLAMENDKIEVDSIMWVDDDIKAPNTAVVQLYKHRRDIAAGVYFTASEKLSEPLIFPGPGAGTDEFIPNLAYETWGVGMGICLVKTSVYKRLAKFVSKDKCGNPEYYKTTGGGEIDESGLMCGGGTEDLYFCDLASKHLGITPFVDTSINAFGWHMDRKTHKGFPREQWNQLKAGEQVVWNTSKGTFMWGK